MKRKRKTANSTERLIHEIHNLHTEAWDGAAPPSSQEERHQRVMVDVMRAASVDLIQRGVTSVILEGAYLIWWLRIACLNHHFAEGGFERSLGRIGPIIGPVSDILVRLGNEIQDDGPPEAMKRLAEKIEQLRGLTGGATWPTSPDASAAQTELAHAIIGKTLEVAAPNAGVPSEVIESALLYFWFRCTANRHGLSEALFQKLERHWGLVMEHVNHHMHDQAIADRNAAQRRGLGHLSVREDGRQGIPDPAAPSPRR